jgi:lipopolysaccharide transport system ATP-binding protein
MSRREIASKFDEIVAFAELSKFIDTPVKRYSSGMYVRLAFAVAAHLEPEVLVVDEVLAVGDGAFQAKCIGKMNDVALTQGRTVVFVSHNLAAVRQLCTRAVMLHEGAVAIHGPTDQVLGVYADQLRGPCIVSGAALEDRLKRASGAVRFTSVTCVAADGKETWIFDEQDEITVFLRYEVISDVDSLGLYLALQSSLSSEVVTSLKEPICHSRVASTHQGTIRVKLFGGCLRTGDYSLYICLGTRDCDRLFDIIDHNVGLPYLRLQSKKRDPHLTEGYFTIPYSISADPDSIANTASFSPSLK